MKKIITAASIITVLSLPGAASAENRTHLLNSDNNSLVITTNDGGSCYYQYFGPKISAEDIGGFFGVRSNYTHHTLPQFGVYSTGENALTLKMPDGNISVDLELRDIDMTTDNRGELMTLTFADKVYPLTVKQYFRRYADTEVFSTNTSITNNAKKGNVTVISAASACVPVTRGDNYLTQFHGSWGNETNLTETPLPDGQTVIADKAGLRNAFGSNPGFLLTLDGPAREKEGEVFAGNLMWSGDYKTKINATPGNISVISGINDDVAEITLGPGETFTTPEFLMTYSSEGKGGISRNFHKWGRKYGMAHGDIPRDILLNSWEGVYFGVNQEVMNQMMADISALGGELFVMDDGWFGDKYPRDNDHTSLGDWMVSEKKLPLGIKGLTDAAKSHNIKFGIWIEPEMANTKSELYEKHPDWVLTQKNRPLTTGRGGTQVVLDLTNPAVQQHVFEVTDNLLSANPEIAYIKWDCNADIMNYGSQYLPVDRQSEIMVRYHEGLHKTLDRIREKYPDVVIQLCASGGGRADYGLLPWFDEFWTSDNTDALQRVFIQWGDSHFMPAIAMASHVSASPNHQTGRVLPIKFRFDVAMSGRLGMEIQPKNMSEKELEFSKRAIEAYKQVRDVVQMGDLYRLVSPYDNGPVSALMYSTPDKKRSVVFAYRINFFNGQPVANLKLDGVDENKTYRITDLTPANPERPSALNGREVSGRVLKHAGINIGQSLNHPYSSLALELTEI